MLFVWKPGWPCSSRLLMISAKGTSSNNCWETEFRSSLGNWATLPVRGRLLGGNRRGLGLEDSKAARPTSEVGDAIFGLGLGVTISFTISFFISLLFVFMPAGLARAGGIAKRGGRAWRRRRRWRGWRRRRWSRRWRKEPYLAIPQRRSRAAISVWLAPTFAAFSRRSL